MIESGEESDARSGLDHGEANAEVTDGATCGATCEETVAAVIFWMTTVLQRCGAIWMSARVSSFEETGEGILGEVMAVAETSVALESGGGSGGGSGAGKAGGASFCAL